MRIELSDVELILLVLAGLYLFESCFWLRRGSEASVTRFGFPAKPRETPSFFGNDSGCVVIAGPAPFDAAFIAEPLPISMDDRGILGYVARCPVGTRRRDQACGMVLWEDAKDVVAVDREIRVGGRVLVRTRSARSAGVLAESIRNIAGADAKNRASLIGELLSSTFDADSVKQRVLAWRSRTLGLRSSSTVLFLWVFPYGFARSQGWVADSSSTLSLLAYLGGFFLFWIWSVVELYFAHRGLYRARKRERLKLVLLSAVSPAAAMRGADHLARDLFDFVHPWALAAAVCRPADVETVYRETTRDLCYPQLPECEVDSPEAQSREAKCRAQTRNALQPAARAYGLNPDESAAARQPEDPSSLSYCPRCLREFLLNEGACDDCGGRRLVRFE